MTSTKLQAMNETTMIRYTSTPTGVFSSFFVFLLLFPTGWMGRLFTGIVWEDWWVFEGVEWGLRTIMRDEGGVLWIDIAVMLGD